MRTQLQGFLCSIAILSILIAGTFVASRTEKTLKSPGRGLPFFQTAKNPVAEAKPGLMGLCNQSAFNLQISSSRQTLAPPSRVAVALSVSQTLPSGIFILRAISRRLIPAAYPAS